MLPYISEHENGFNISIYTTVASVYDYPTRHIAMKIQEMYPILL